MALDEIMEKTTISLPWSLDLEHTEGLLRYIARELPANIHYQASYYNTLITEGKKVKDDPGTVKITGNITSIKETMAFDSFETEHDPQQTQRIAKIRFSLVPDWDIEDYRPEIRQLWDRTREVVMQYFEKVPNI